MQFVRAERRTKRIVAKKCILLVHYILHTFRQGSICLPKVGRVVHAPDRHSSMAYRNFRGDEARTAFPRRYSARPRSTFASASSTSSCHFRNASKSSRRMTTRSSPPLTFLDMVAIIETMRGSIAYVSHSRISHFYK